MRLLQVLLLVAGALLASTVVLAAGEMPVCYVPADNAYHDALGKMLTYMQTTAEHEPGYEATLRELGFKAALLLGEREDCRLQNKAWLARVEQKLYEQKSLEATALTPVR